MNFLVPEEFFYRVGTSGACSSDLNMLSFAVGPCLVIVPLRPRLLAADGKALHFGGVGQLRGIGCFA